MRIPTTLSHRSPPLDHVAAPATVPPRVRAVDWAPTSTRTQATERPAGVDLPGLWPGRSQMQAVMPNVWVTNYFGARNLAQLKAQAITHVVVCAGELPEAFPGQFAYLQLPNFADNPAHPLKAQLDQAIPFILQALSEGGHVLLHCAAGSSRSGAVAMALLMHLNKMTAAEALAEVQKARPVILPNPGFIRQLETWQLG